MANENSIIDKRKITAEEIPVPESEAEQKRLRARFDTLISELHKALYIDAGRALQMAVQAVDFARKLAIPILHVRALFYCVECNHYLGRADEMERYVEKAQEIAELLQTSSERAEFLTGLGTFYNSKPDFKRAHRYLTDALQLIDISGGNPQAKLQTLVGLGYLYRLVGAYEESLHYLLRALSEFDGLPQGRCPFGVLINIGDTYFGMSDEQRALSYYHKALDLCTAGDRPAWEAMARACLGTIYARGGQPEQALVHLQRAADLFKEVKHHISVANLLLRKSNVYEILGNDERAIEEAERARACAKEGKVVTYVNIVCQLAGLYRKTDRPEEAEKLLDEALAISNRHQLGDAAYVVHGQLAEFGAEQGNLQKAYEHYRRFHELSEQLRGRERQRAIADLEMRHAFELDRKEREALLLKAENAKRETDRKVRELQTFSLNLSQRNEVLKDILNLAAPLAQTAQGKMKEFASGIVTKVRSLARSASQWQIFEEQFHQTYRDFIRTLHSRNGSLTPAEIKICVLIRLELSTRQIAEMLFVSEETVKTHRKHIRQKLRIVGNLDLAHYLSEF